MPARPATACFAGQLICGLAKTTYPTPPALGYLCGLSQLRLLAMTAVHRLLLHTGARASCTGFLVSEQPWAGQIAKQGFFFWTDGSTHSTLSDLARTSFSMFIFESV